MGLATAPPIRGGDHACCVYGSDAHQSELVGRFARDAFARGDRLFYLADRSDESDIVGMLDGGRLLLDSGALQILHSSEMGLEDGFDAERQNRQWSALVAQAHDDGFSGLAATAEMTWTQTWNVDPHAVVEYEASAGSLFADGTLSALCQYDTRHWNHELIPHAANAHPCALALHDGGWSANWSRMHLHRADDTRVLALGGAIDLANVELLEEQVVDLLADGDAVVDCSDVTFIDVAGCRVLRRAAQGEFGPAQLALTHVPPAVERVMRLCDWATLPRA